MTKYTAADFANAKFAEHPDGGLATRSGEGYYTWEVGGVPLATDEIMAQKGWVPVPTKPTITESEFEDIKTGWGKIAAQAWLRGFTKAGGEIIPDPEPTNADRLEEILKEVWTPAQSARTFAEWLDSNGVTAPKVKGN